MQLDGVPVVEYDKSILTVAMAMINVTMETNQVDARALEIVFEEAVKEARELLKECVYG